jgi:hypothetical protein
MTEYPTKGVLVGRDRRRIGAERGIARACLAANHARAARVLLLQGRVNAKAVRLAGMQKNGPPHRTLHIGGGGGGQSHECLPTWSAQEDTAQM